jgi:uncharacterized protein (DUF58 family)
MNQSSSKGLGMNFSEVREYHFGDETRFIDWNVTARYNNPHVKVFEEDREHVNVFFIDVSGSLDFGAKTRSKRQVLVELFASMAFSCAHSQDKIGAVFFSDEVVKYFEPKKGHKHVWHMLQFLIENDFNSAASDPTLAFTFFQKTKWQKYRVFLFSDLIFSNTNEVIDAFKKVKKKNQAHVVKVYDKLELMAPLPGFYRLVNAESGISSWVNGFSSKTKKEYKQLHAEIDQLWMKECRKANIHISSLATDDDIFSKLNGFF